MEILDKLVLFLIGGIVFSGIIYWCGIVYQSIKPKIILTEKEFNMKINEAYLRGYEQGKSAGRQEELFEKYSINHIREAFGMSPIGQKQDKVNLKLLKCEGNEIVVLHNGKTCITRYDNSSDTVKSWRKTYNLSDDDLITLSVPSKYKDMDILKIFIAENRINNILPLCEEERIGEQSKEFNKVKKYYPCYYEDLQLIDPQGVWKDGKFYEWIDKHGNVETARMKSDTKYHFYPNTNTIQEEDVIGFCEVK